MPDFFVPLDTTQYTAFHRQLAAKGLIINASLKYVDEHRNELKRRYTSFDQFCRDFTVPKSETDSIIADAARQKVKPRDDKELQQTLPMLRTQLKALVARDIWDMSEYFQIVNETNHIVRKGVQLLTGK